MKFSSATHVGRVRQENEDYVIAKKGIFIVADGMGGHKAGEVASKTAALTALKVIESEAEADKLALLKKAVEEANTKVLEKSQEVDSQNGMGTTFTVAVLDDSLNAYFAHIGDSRAYLLRAKKFEQITNDHSLVAQMVEEGKITKDEASEHPYRNVITRAVGSEPNIEIDLFSKKLKAGDRLLLASDGLTSFVKDGQILSIINENDDLDSACNELINAANEVGGQDNISVILIEIGSKKSKKAAGKKSKKQQAKERTKTKSRSIWQKIFLFLLGILISFALAFGALIINNNNYYLYKYEDKVALYQGLPYKVFGYKLSRVKYTSDVDYAELDSALKKRIKRRINVKNKAEGLQAIDDIEEGLSK